METERLLPAEAPGEDFEDFYEYAAGPEMCRMMGRGELAGKRGASPSSSLSRRG